MGIFNSIIDLAAEAIELTGEVVKLPSTILKGVNKGLKAINKDEDKPPSKKIIVGGYQPTKSLDITNPPKGGSVT